MDLDITINGTLTRDFQPLFFFIQQLPHVPFRIWLRIREDNPQSWLHSGGNDTAVQPIFFRPSSRIIRHTVFFTRKSDLAANVTARCQCHRCANMTLLWLWTSYSYTKRLLDKTSPRQNVSIQNVYLYTQSLLNKTSPQQNVSWVHSLDHFTFLYYSL
jgi:hypothetical protein